MTNLPEFRTHGYDQKFLALTHEPSPLPQHTLHYLRLISELAGDLNGIRILDMGCGRGELVRALRERGAKAFGIEIDPRFIESGGIINNMRFGSSNAALARAMRAFRNAFYSGTKVPSS